MNQTLAEQMRVTLNLLPAYAWFTTPSGGLTFVNQRSADYLGLPIDHPLRFGTSADAAWDSHVPLLHPEDQEETRKVWSDCLRTGRAGEVTFRVRDSHANYRWFLSRTEPVRESDGTITGWIGINFDIEERKQAELSLAEGQRALRESEGELRQMLDLTPQLIVVFGPNFQRLYANQAALDYAGFTLEGWRLDDRDVVHPDDRPNRDDHAGRDSAYSLELRVRGADGNYRWFLVRYNPLHDDKGQVKRWYVASTDIEDRKRAEQKLQQENVALREEIDKASMFEEIVGTSRPLKAVLSRIAKVAPTDSTVLITGETGTGKELIARAVHKRSQRSGRPFVSVNCAALPPTLVSSELFGHEKGAFTGATQRRLGRFEMADGGTIFLDEVGELLPDTQAALLRVLQEREFERVGGGQPVQVDVRVIAATNRDLNAAVANGTFRQDLLYRLNVFPIEMPPLRERKDDILILVEYFVQRYANRAGRNIRSIDQKTLDLLQSYDWPGNIRELQNVIERSVVLSETEEFAVDDSWLLAAPQTQSGFGLSGKVAAHEKAIVEEALRATGGRVFGPSGAAARLGIPRSTLESKIRALKINKSRFRVRSPIQAKGPTND